jgi:radical SAM enzyme (TIGR01210 family)
MLKGRLEVAMGLETANPQVLALLNKGMTTDDFVRAANYLHAREIDIRTFILVRPPFMTEDEGIEWACKSLDYAWQCGSRICSLIPTRGGNGALETLAVNGFFQPPRLDSLETACEYGLEQGRSLVFADLWDLERFADCDDCFPRRRDRLAEMNYTQQVAAQVTCQCSGGSAA